MKSTKEREKLTEKLSILVSACINKVVCGKIEIDVDDWNTRFSAKYESPNPNANGLRIFYSDNRGDAYIRVNYNKEEVFLANSKIKTDDKEGYVISGIVSNIPHRIPPSNDIRHFNIYKYSSGEWEKMISDPPGCEDPARHDI